MIPSPTPPEPGAPYYLIRTCTGIHAVSAAELDPRDEIIYANDFPTMQQAGMTAAVLRKVAEFDDPPPYPKQLPEESVIELIQDTDNEIHQAEKELAECERLAEELTK